MMKGWFLNVFETQKLIFYLNLQRQIQFLISNKVTWPCTLCDLKQHIKVVRKYNNTV